MMNHCDCEGCVLKSLFFENVSTSEIESICSRKTESTYKKGEMIIREGDDIEQFIYLKEGLVKLFKKGVNEKDQIICFARPLDFVSLLSIFSEKQYHYSVSALEDAVTCNISLVEITNIAQLNGKFTLGLMEKMNKATDRIILDFLKVKKKRLNGRIAYMLLYFSREVYKSNAFNLPVSRKEMAEYIGMTVENVIRTLSDFKKDQIIKIDGTLIEIIETQRLERILELS
jgi:CRP-like cAMP-binding protein